MKRSVKIIALAVALLVFAVTFLSCGVDVKDPEIIDAAKKLINAAYDINDIYFGEGLPISEKDSEAAKKFAEENGFDNTNIQFLPVTEESPYFSIDEIKKATEKVYSASYCEYLYSMAFEGYSTEDGTAAVYAKYMEDESGTLTVRIDLAENPLPERTYDLESMTVRSKSEDRAVVTMDSYLEGEKEEGTVSFTLVKEEKGWRLDTPTY